MKNQKLYRIVSTVAAVALSMAIAQVAYAAPAFGPLPQDGGGAFDGIINSLVDMIKAIARPVALLGLVGWGVAQFAQPFAPEINSRFQGYATKVVFGAVLVVFGADLVDWLFSIG
jgi:hypothetical protein